MVKKKRTRRRTTRKTARNARPKKPRVRRLRSHTVSEMEFEKLKKNLMTRPGVTLPLWLKRPENIEFLRVLNSNAFMASRLNQQFLEKIDKGPDSIVTGTELLDLGTGIFPTFIEYEHLLTPDNLLSKGSCIVLEWSLSGRSSSPRQLALIFSNSGILRYRETQNFLIWGSCCKAPADMRKWPDSAASHYLALKFKKDTSSESPRGFSHPILAGGSLSRQIVRIRTTNFSPSKKQLKREKRSIDQKQENKKQGDSEIGSLLHLLD